MAYFIGKDIPEQLIAPEFRTELMSVFETGHSKKRGHTSLLSEMLSLFQAEKSTRGIDIKFGGDVITKTIRLRYKHLKGWIEDQETIKVNAYYMWIPSSLEQYIFRYAFL